MSENQPPEGNPPNQPDVEEPVADRRLAHERLSTGGLARWMRACASHPWRVIVSWVGIIAALIVLVATVGGSLKDEFSIPGSDTQRATDLIESEFAEEQGGVLNLVFAAPEGEAAQEPSFDFILTSVLQAPGLRMAIVQPTGGNKAYLSTTFAKASVPVMFNAKL